jgi:hypothetical protein
MMDPGYYYSREGQRFGPVPGEQLKQLAAAGQLQPDDLIWKEGMANWIQAARVKGLFSAAALQPPEITVAPLDPAPVSNAAASSNPPPAASSPRQDEPSDAARVARQAKDAAVAASSDALKAFKILVKNPVGGLREAFETMGPTAALGVGIVFGVVFVLCVLLGVWFMAGGIHGVSAFFKELLLAVIPVAAAIGGYFAARSAFRGQGGIQADVFVAGASLLPAGAAILLVGILASQNIIIPSVILLFGFTTTTLMSYSGCTTVLRIPDAVATIVVPSIFIIDAVAAHFLGGNPMASTIGP